MKGDMPIISWSWVWKLTISENVNQIIWHNSMPTLSLLLHSDIFLNLMFEKDATLMIKHSSMFLGTALLSKSIGLRLGLSF
jgi:hypothetical protein